MKDKISICIPTYKREKYLIQNLTVLIRQIKKYNFEIVICDNDSEHNDLLANEISKFKKAYGNITYIKNDENIGMDKNMIKSAQIAKGEYCFWLGDDDIIQEDCIEKLNSVVENYNYDLILINTTWISESLDEKGSEWKRKEGIVYNDVNDFFRNHVFDMPFGAIVIKREYLKHINITKYYGTFHAYSGYIIEYLNYIEKSRKINVLVSSELKVYLRNCEKSWSENGFKIHFEKIPKWFYLLPLELAGKEIMREYLKKTYSVNNIISNIRWIGEIDSLDLVYKVTWINKFKINILKKIYPIYLSIKKLSI